MQTILGYTDPMSAAPGERLRVMVSCESGASTYRADLVRLYCGDDHPAGPGFREVEIASPINGEHPARFQPTHAGSYARLESGAVLDALESFSVAVVIWPTTPLGRSQGQGQGLMTRWSEQAGGFGLFVGEHGGMELHLGDGGEPTIVRCDRPLIAREWYLVGATFDLESGTATVFQRSLAGLPRNDPTQACTITTAVRPKVLGQPFLLAACNDAAEDESFRAARHFNGKLERPQLYSSAIAVESLAERLESPRSARSSSLIAAWDFSLDIPSQRATDVSDHGNHAELVNLPTRGVTGSGWSGDFLAWRAAPEQYGAIYFHDDDLLDASWACDFELELPAQMASGVYAIRLRDGDSEDHVPFFVRPRRDRVGCADVAFLAATGTYIAYANNHAAYTEALDEMEWGALTEVQLSDVYLSGHYELGLSTYDTHADGSGVPYSSRLRPILTMRPRYRLWNFNADLHLVDWLDRQQQAFDVITDEDLDTEGAELLGPYRVLITSTHPEYCSKPMLDAIETFKARGGRLIYLGGNGFYWRICFNRAIAGVIECRKSEGVRSWEAAPGERYHSFTGEPGGLWRNLGRAPQATAGVGTSAFGFADCAYYRRRPESHDARAAFIFEGIGDDDEPIGDFGVTGGAVGFEIDRVDRDLGTPAHCLALASSEGLSRLYMLSPEEARFIYPAMSGEDNNRVRADMVFYELASGGAVFSTGSITWAASLSHNQGDNNVSMIMGNVLRRFVDPEPFVVERDGHPRPGD